MKWRIIAGTLALSLGILIIPVLFTQLQSTDDREFEFPRLANTDYEEVRFENQSADIDLAGLLFIPEGAGPFPAAVIIHGSGTSRRDSGWYLTLAEHLQQNGILVLLPDKRGSEQSGGDWRTASLEDLATDTGAAIDFLRDHSPVPVSEIGIIGMSQGGHIAPIVASRRDDLGFVVNMVGAATPMHAGLVYEEIHNLREMGVLPGVSDVLAYPGAWSLIYWRQKDFWDSVGDFDPLPYWREVTTDTLVLYGSEDTNVDTGRSVDLLESLQNRRIRVIVFEGSGHALETPIGQGNRLIRPEALETISAFIHQADQ